jgi:hypothetical protein
MYYDRRERGTYIDKVLEDIKDIVVDRWLDLALDGDDIGITPGNLPSLDNGDNALGLAFLGAKLKLMPEGFDLLFQGVGMNIVQEHGAVDTIRPCNTAGWREGRASAL